MYDVSEDTGFSAPEGLRKSLADGITMDPLVTPAATLNAAAVQIPIVARETPSVLFTLRATDLSLHAGQISYPGGRFQQEDGTFLETALRETEEETGITRNHVEVVGFLDPYLTSTGYTVIPVVGFLKQGFTLVRNEHEVAEIFEVPLNFLLDPENRALRRAERNGVWREFHSIRYRDYEIWGATAGMIVNLSQRLQGR
jgi:8-oxo-dGTP pyrophosphatase MutT (NUDIX family)